MTGALRSLRQKKMLRQKTPELWESGRLNTREQKIPAPGNSGMMAPGRRSRQSQRLVPSRE